MLDSRACSRPLRLGLAACLPILLGACSFDASQRWRSAPKPVLEVTLDYRAKPGDRIRVNFMRRLFDSSVHEYSLQYGDELRLSVQDREDLSCVSAVAPDGNLYLPYLDPLPAKGRTLAEIRRSAGELYQPIAKSARISIVPVRFAAQVDALLKDLSTPGRPGSTFDAPIGLDGKAAFPYLENLPVAGASPREISNLLRGRYATILPGIEVFVGLEGGASRLLTVLGEMRRPGAFPVDGSVSLTTALGLGEGWLASARLEDIVLIRRIDGKVIISKHDLQKDLVMATQLQLAGGDLVFVPRTAITDLNVFVDQYLRRNLPVPVGLSLPFPGL